jgi:hypothetical protein
MSIFFSLYTYTLFGHYNYWQSVSVDRWESYQRNGALLCVPRTNTKQMSELTERRIFFFLLNLRKIISILNSKGNETVRSHYSFMAIVSTIICPFSFREKNKKHTLAFLPHIYWALFFSCRLFRNHVSFATYSFSL